MLAAAVAEERVHRAVAIALQAGAALQDQVVDVVRQPEVGGGEDRVVTSARGLEYLVASVVDEIGIVAGAAGHDVGPGTAVEDVVAAVAEERIHRSVAVTLQAWAARQVREVGR